MASCLASLRTNVGRLPSDCVCPVVDRLLRRRPFSLQLLCFVIVQVQHTPALVCPLPKLCEKNNRICTSGRRYAPDSPSRDKPLTYLVQVEVPVLATTTGREPTLHSHRRLDTLQTASLAIECLIRSRQRKRGPQSRPCERYSPLDRRRISQSALQVVLGASFLSIPDGGSLPQPMAVYAFCQRVCPSAFGRW